jgi:exosome complex protein LRP1
LHSIIHPLNYYRTPCTGQLVIDKAAATRFIKNAIAQANDTISTNASNSGPATTSTSTSTTRPHIGDQSGNGKNVRVPAKMTEKMLEREKYHEALREEAQLASDDDGEPLEIIDNDDGDEEEEKDEGKANAALLTPPGIHIPPIPGDPPPFSAAAAAEKRRRPPVDPFAGSCGFSSAHVSLADLLL